MKKLFQSNRSPAILASRNGYLVLAACLVFLLAGCTAAPTAAPQPTAASPDAAASGSPASIRELIDHTDQYAARTISLGGKIALECPEGCWFFLDDGTAKLYVDLKPAGLTIPQKQGSRVTVKGKVQGSGGNLQLLGEEVKFLDE